MPRVGGCFEWWPSATIVLNGSLGDEIGAGQFLPLTDRKADIAYGMIVVRRSNWADCLLSDLQADLAYGPSE